ncbi:hypothetical protein O4H49_16235 [Kiloniella laminariae]|uniref:Methyltransferase type 11 domain-containing protein n=1 Tax=Kiloniella laminariae TaxID=454162 RepID=A0ABT4LMP2_9PROT|nr:hypothetical protein [Kiloniella laminariae]MCZ4282336.1 hypothetical protein [Kiloniella laminariae]
MRSILLTNSYDKSDIKPTILIQEYQKLLTQDIQDFFKKPTRKNQACNACNAPTTEPAFSRLKLQYNECLSCGSLQVDDRPTTEQLSAFIKYSKAIPYWNEKLATSTAPERFKHIIQPRLDWIAQGISEYKNASSKIGIIDAQPDYTEALKALPNLFSPQNIHSLHSPDKNSISISSLKGNCLDACLAFESFDASLHPRDDLGKVAKALNKGGLLFITSILGSGFDIRVLRERCESILPPDRMNLFTVEGWKILLQDSGFEVLEFSTPGSFDTNNVKSEINTNKEFLQDKFVSYLFSNREQKDLDAFQNFLQEALLSSYGRILARKV